MIIIECLPARFTASTSAITPYTGAITIAIAMLLPSAKATGCRQAQCNMNFEVNHMCNKSQPQCIMNVTGYGLMNNINEILCLELHLICPTL